MKDFLKFTLASLIGIILAGIIFTVIGVVSVVGMVTSSDTETQVEENSVFVLDFNGALAERAPEDAFGKLIGASSEETYGLDDILASIRKAKEHEDIKGIYLQPTHLSTSSFASLEEIRNALLDFKKSGKFIVAYADAYSQDMYYLCSVADKVMVNPKGSLGWHGLATQVMFFKDLLEKVGVEVQIFKVGTYKSAVEPFISTEMSPANREQVTAYVGATWDHVVKAVSESRQISTDSLNALADKYMDVREPSDYLSCGLADSLVYKDEAMAYLKQLTDRGEDDDLNALFLEDMINVKRNTPRDKSGNAIAIYYAEGDIVDEQLPSTSMGAVIDQQKVTRDLRRLRDDESVKAVVLRVNSPGGSAFASEQIWREVVQLKEKKPVVVSMGDYAASGGYYISCAATTIFAQPTTLTGSIGIFGMFPSGEKLLGDKLGLHFDGIKTNEMSDAGLSLFGSVALRPFNEHESEVIQQYINNGYSLFVSRCAEGRGMTTEAIDKIAQGRVWTGETALELGLVDQLGGIDDALQEAAKLAGVEDYTVLHKPEKESVLNSLLSSGSSHYVNSQMKQQLGLLYPSFQMLQSLKDSNPVQARLPFLINY